MARLPPDPSRLDGPLPPTFAKAGKVPIKPGEMDFTRSCSVELAPPQRAEGQRRNLRPQSAWAKLFPVDGYWSPTSVETSRMLDLLEAQVRCWLNLEHFREAFAAQRLPAGLPRGKSEG